jgi:hypothetical protein
MSLFYLLFVLIIVGVALWLINSYLPMDKKIKTILNIVVVIVVVLWLFNVFGGSNMHLGNLYWRR